MATAYFAMPGREKSVPPATESVSITGTAEHEASRHVEEELAALRRENAELKEQLQAYQAAAPTPAPPATPTAPVDENPASPFAAFFGDGSDTNRAKAVERMMRTVVEQQVEMKVSALKLRLKLTDEQEQAVRALFNEQMGQGVELGTKMLQGKLSKEDMAKASEKPADFRSELKELLTPEQWTAYEAYEVEERKNQAQMMANAELMQMQQMLQLTDAQQDEVFRVLYDVSEQRLTEAPQAGHASSPGQALQQMNAAKKEALRKVLTPEQFQSYEKFLKSQEDMIKSMMPAFVEEDGAATASAP